MKVWIQAARPRTLLLGLCGPLFVLFAFKANPDFNWIPWAFFTATLLLLQVVSNFANDLGDGIKGSDKERGGEARMFALGQINKRQFVRAITLLSAIALVFGSLSLLFSHCSWQIKVVIFAAGLLAILAALSYTLGKRAYGYLGLGDVSVLLFFGFCAVMVPFVLSTGKWQSFILLPSLAIGLLSVAVLNLNNLRDIKKDKSNHKNTLAVRLGFWYAKLYHLFLLSLPLPLGIVFYQNQMPEKTGNVLALFLISSLMVLMGLKILLAKHDEKKLDALMKFHALGALIFSVTLGIISGI